MGSILNFHNRSVSYTIMAGIKEVAKAALEAAERVREQMPLNVE
jgi:hypothetical protein